MSLFKRIKWSYVIAGIIAMAVALWLLSGMLSESGQKGPNPQKPPMNIEKEAIIAVKVQENIAKMKSQTLRLTGRTHVKTRLWVKAEQNGTLKKWFKDAGDPVEKGETLAILSPGTLYSDLDEAQALLETRRQEYENGVALAKKELLGKTELSGLKSALASANARLKRIEKSIKDLKITAPIDGIIEERAIETGDLLAPGQQTFLLITTETMVVHGFLGEKDVNRIDMDSAVTVDAPDGKIDGKITFISQAAQGETRTFLVKAEIPNNGKLRAGMTLAMAIETKSQKAHFIPQGVLTLDDDGNVGVKVVDDENKVVFFAVELLEEQENGIWVTDLPDKVSIITQGQEYVQAGNQAEVKP